jgi:hypothetical protein
MDYSNGKIYKIVCNTTGKCYIGSTCSPYLSTRLAQHRNNFKSFLKGKFNYVSSYEVLENNNYDIVLLELFPCSCKEELLARERFYIENTECVNLIQTIIKLKETFAIKQHQYYYYILLL